LKNFTEFIEYNFNKKLIDILHEGVIVVKIESINEDLMSYFDDETKMVIKKAKDKGDKALIADFIPEMRALVKKFAKSGQSGGSAPYYAKAITDALHKLMMFKPLLPVMNEDDEWSEGYESDDKKVYQNKRLSSVFKNGKNGKPYYIDAIVFKGNNGVTFTSGGSVKTKDGKKISSFQYIKKFPFEPKTFVIDVIETEWEKQKDGKLIKKEGGGWWTSVVKDEKQLDKVWKYYDKKA